MSSNKNRLSNCLCTSYLFYILILVFGALNSNEIRALQVNEFLTPEEKKWLEQNKNAIRYSIPNYPPYHFLDEHGTPSGFVADQIALIEKYFGMKFQLVQSTSWNEIITMARDHKIDMFSSVTPAEERKTFLDFSPALLEAEAALIVRSDAQHYKAVEEMCTKTIGVGKGYITTMLFSNQFPCIKLREFDDDVTGLKSVAFGEIDGFLSDIGTATWLIRKHQLNNLRLGSDVLCRTPGCIAVRNDNKILTSIIKKGITAIPIKEREAIKNRWIGNLERQALGPVTYLVNTLPVFIPVLILLIISLLWSWMLRKTVALRTRELTLRSRQLAENEQFYREIFNSTSDALFIHDINGQILDINERASRMYGYTRDTFLSIDVKDISFGEAPYSQEQVSEMFKRVQKEGPLVFEWRCKGRDGELFWVEVALRSCSILGEMRVIASVRDINDRKITEATLRENNERLIHSEKMEAIGHLAGGIAHDFNNMLTGIIASAEILQNYIPEDQTARKFLSMINSSAVRASDLARNLLIFARRQITVKRPIDAHQCVLDAVSILQNTIDKRIVITTELSSKCSVVSGDKSQIQSAFLNLGINASHAMPGGGNLEFRSHMVYLSTDDCTKYPFKLSEGDYISLDVTDTGCGIPPEVLPHIFEPFFTTKGQGKGNGLGLAATYGMVQQHSGTITVDSIVGKGTHLKILLPLIDDKETESVLPELVNGKGLVLVVDDEEIIRITSQVNLEKLSYSVLSAHNGKKAIEVYTKNKGSISLVLLDMVMPEMNGRDCFFKLKVINPDVRVILMSGFSQDDDIQEMREIGLAGFIHKPFHMLELSKIVDDVLKR